MRRRRILRTLSVLLLGVLLAPASRAQSLRGLKEEFAAIGQEVIPATVIVRSPQAMKGLPGSSGVIVSSDGYVLSDADATLTTIEAPSKPGEPAVKHHGRTAIVRLPAPDHRTFNAVLVKRDEQTDTSLLKIQDPPQDLPHLSLGDSDPLRVGDFLMVVGNGMGTAREGEPSLTLGAASALLLGKGKGVGRYQWIYTSASVTPGSNGGPVVDITGRIVGIVSTFVPDPKSPFRGLGKVTPIDRIRPRYRSVKGAKDVFAPPRDPEKPPHDATILQDAFSIIVHHAFSSVVSIEVERKGEKGTRRVRAMNGRIVDVPLYPGPYSGIVISREGLILTSLENLWELPTIQRITVHFSDGRTLPAQVRARDEIRRLAVLSVPAKDLVPLPIAKPEDVVVGRFALALGNPFGSDHEGGPLFTFGLVSDLHRIAPCFDAIQTDAGMNDAMAGGALLTIDGKLLGMAALLYVSPMLNPDRYGRNSGIGFAIPMSVIDGVLPRLEKGESIERGFLGVRIGLVGKGIGFPTVEPNSPAAKAGVLGGDLLVAVDGKKLGSELPVNELLPYLASKGVGEKIALTVRRGSRNLTLDVTLGSRPKK